MGYSLPVNATLLVDDMGKVLRNIKKCCLVTMIVLCKTNKKMNNFRTYVVLKSYTYVYLGSSLTDRGLNGLFHVGYVRLMFYDQDFLECIFTLDVLPYVSLSTHRINIVFMLYLTAAAAADR